MMGFLEIIHRLNRYSTLAKLITRLFLVIRPDFILPTSGTRAADLNDSL